MTHYIDIRLIPKKELQENILLNQLYTEFHQRLFDLKLTNIGVSFPRYKKVLGNVFRIHGTKEILEKLQDDEWIKKYPKNYNLSKVTTIPTEVKYRNISRIQQTMSQSKLRRLIKRAEEGKGGIKKEDIKKYKIKMLQGGLDNPFVELNSVSSKQRYRLFINLGELMDSQTTGEFDTFGLSKTSTVPWF